MRQRISARSSARSARGETLTEKGAEPPEVVERRLTTDRLAARVFGERDANVFRDLGRDPPPRRLHEVRWPDVDLDDRPLWDLHVGENDLPSRDLRREVTHHASRVTERWNHHQPCDRRRARRAPTPTVRDHTRRSSESSDLRPSRTDSRTRRPIRFFAHAARAGVQCTPRLDACHACGMCVVACAEKALTLVPR